MKNLRSLFASVLVLVGTILVTTVVVVPEARSATPCCNITAINAKTGMVSVRDMTSGKTAQFKVNEKSPEGRAVLRELKIGQKVSADFTKGAVRVSSAAVFPFLGAKPCPCGKHDSGSCACACGIFECEIYCMIGECRNGVSPGGTKPVFVPK